MYIVEKNDMSIKGSTTTADYIEFDKALNKGIKLMENERTASIGLYLIVSINTGLRISDTLQLTWEQLQADDVELKEIKTGKLRSFKVNNHIKKAIKLFKGKKEGFVFVGREGLYTPQQINRKLKTIFKNEVKNGAKISSHSLRKSFGRRVYDNLNQCEDALVKLSELFNHTSLAVTRTYLGLRKRELDNIYITL